MKRWLSKKELLYISISSFLLAFFIISLGQTDQLLLVVTHEAFLPDLLSVAFIHFVVITYIVVVHNWLEPKYPLREKLSPRILRQIIWGWVVPCLISLGLGYLYLHFILGYNVPQTSFFSYEYPISTIIIGGINLVLIVITLLMNGETHVESPAKEYKSALLLNHGDKKIPVHTTDIACILKESEFSLVYTFDGRQFVISESLDETTQTLDPKTFFRANRQSIINRKTCGPFQVNRSGKIDLALTFPEGKQIPISQKRAQEFKNWLKGELTSD